MRASECFLQEFWAINPPWTKPTDNTTAMDISKTAGGMDPWCMQLVEGTRVCHLRSNNGAPWGRVGGAARCCIRSTRPGICVLDCNCALIF